MHIYVNDVGTQERTNPLVYGMRKMLRSAAKGFPALDICLLHSMAIMNVSTSFL